MSYSTEPPATPYQRADLQAEVDATFKRDVSMDHSGTAEIEGYAVMYGANGPDKAFMALRTPEDRRAWAVSEDTDVLVEMTREEFCGRTVTVADHVASF